MNSTDCPRNETYRFAIHINQKPLYSFVPVSEIAIIAKEIERRSQRSCDYLEVSYFILNHMDEVIYGATNFENLMLHLSKLIAKDRAPVDHRHYLVSDNEPTHGLVDCELRRQAISRIFSQRSRHYREQKEIREVKRNHGILLRSISEAESHFRPITLENDMASILSRAHIGTTTKDGVWVDDRAIRKIVAYYRRHKNHVFGQSKRRVAIQDFISAICHHKREFADEVDSDRKEIA